MRTLYFHPVVSSFFLRDWTVVRELIFVRIRSVGTDMLIIKLSIAVFTMMSQNEALYSYQNADAGS